MAMKDNMYKKIVQEIDENVEVGKFDISGKEAKLKSVAKMLTELSVDETRDADILVNQYIANIKNLCKE